MKQHSTPQIGNAGRSRTLQALWLALANLLSLSVTLVMQAVLCRYMTTSEYGTYSQVLYVYNTLLAVFSLGLPKAYSYYLARVSPEEGRDIVRKLNGLFLLLASVFSCILLWQAAAIAGVLGNPLLAEPLRLFAAAPMLLMPVLGVENILVVYGKAHLVAVYVLISRAFMIACVVLPVVVFDAGVSGAVAGFVLASLVTCVAGLKLSSVPFRNVSPVKSRLTVRELLRFSMPVFASSMYGFVIGSASQFFVSRYLGVEDFALFANGYRELPLAGMIIGAAAGVLLPEFSRMSGEGADGGQFVRLWQAAVLKSSAIIYPLSVFCCVFAPEIICLLYGEGYREAAGLFRIVTVVNLARIMPYAPVLFALGRGKAFARAHLVTALLIVGLDLLCVMAFPSLWAIAAIATGLYAFLSVPADDDHCPRAGHFACGADAVEDADDRAARIGRGLHGGPAGRLADRNDASSCRRVGRLRCLSVVVSAVCAAGRNPLYGVVRTGAREIAAEPDVRASRLPVFGRRSGARASGF